jgi:hypothetical protein
VEVLGRNSFEKGIQTLWRQTLWVSTFGVVCSASLVRIGARDAGLTLGHGVGFLDGIYPFQLDVVTKRLRCR